MRHVLRTLLTIVCLGLSSAGLADVAETTKLLGVFHVVSLPDSQKAIHDAIEQAIAPMGFLARPVARRRLEAVNPAFETLRITQRGDDLVTDFDGRRYTASVDGSCRRNVDADGKAVRVCYRLAGQSLHARYITEDGEKRYDFRLEPDGTSLLAAVTVSSPQLPRPVSYALRFSRVE